MKPPTYRALQLVRHAQSLRAATALVEMPWCEPGPGEIAVRNAWCGVNAIFDTQIARDAVDYVQVNVPALMGVEAIGTVQRVGRGVSEFAPGDAVVTVRFGGGYREANIGVAGNFVAVPSAEREWLALASTGVSALLALDHVGQARPGETVAISAAAGGLGHLLVQLAKLRGCKVVAICGGAAKTEFVRGLGADRVIDYRNESVADVLRSEFRDALDVAIDTVSGEIFDALLDNIAPHGRLVAGGAAQDLSGRPEIMTGPRVVHKLYYKAASVRGFMNGMLTPLWPQARRRIFEEFDAGRLKVVFDDRRFEGIESICDAAEHLLSGRSMGKVVVRLPAATGSPAIA
jgi:NADPH-dependent curcumin reductase CurA